MPSMVSNEEIQREYQTLRNLRRRSASSPGPGALPLDPDLPPPSPSADISSSSSYSSNDDITLATPDGLDADDPSGLFWVPAHLHPELAPGEFRAFLKSHTHPDPASADGEEVAEAQGMGMSRSPSMLGRNASQRGAGGLGRKRSMLSKQYHPRAGDKVEDEAPPVPLLNRSSSNRSSIYGGRTGEKGLTLEDLQKLEMLADEAALSDNPTSMRTMLRRSLSMNVSPGILEDTEFVGDDADAPIILPRPGSILRRAARTKIRKAGLTGDGGGHRFAATRKGRMTAAPMHEQWSEDAEDDLDPNDPRNRSLGSDDSDERRRSGDRTTGEGSSEGHDERGEQFYDASQHLDERRASDDASTDEAIFDAYARDGSRSSSISSSVTPSRSPSPESPSENQHLALPQLPPLQTSGSDWFKREEEKTPTQELTVDPMMGLRRPSPGTEGGDATPTRPRYPSETQVPSPSPYELPPGMAPPAVRSVVPPGLALQQSKEQALTPVVLERTPPPRPDSALSNRSTASKEKEKEKEKEKKGGFFSKKEKKDKEPKAKKSSVDSGKKEKDKDRFLGSLFGGKKKTEEPVTFSAAGPAAAAALLGSSKSAKSLGVTPGASPTSPGFSNFSRYPIHVERAVYRLSHIKLANARRPLYEQVLISNLMFWYLGVIGRNGSDEKKPAEEEKETRKEEPKVVAKGTPPTAVVAGQGVKPPSVIVAEAVPSPKKSGLVKPERSRTRGNETAVRPPQYGMQNAQMDKELRNGSVNSPTQQYQPPIQPQPQYTLSSPQHPQPPFQRSPSTPPPQVARALSPPAQGQPRPSAPESYPHQPHPLVHRELQGPPRGVPHSSFGPPPPQPAPRPQSPHDDPRQRTMSNPNQTNHPGPLSPNNQGMRRVVTDGHTQPYPPQMASTNMGRRVTDSPTPSPYPSHPRPSHAGPQPGQVFQYPGASVQPGQPFPSRPPPGPQPGQIYQQTPQPGQVFHHPQFSQPRPPAGPPPQRLPPGAGPPSQQWNQYGSPPPPTGYNPRGGPSPPQSGGFYQSSRPPNPQPGQLFNPYPGQPPPIHRHPSQEDAYGRRQPVPPQPSPYGTPHR
ncbi:hypothetical protein P7C73_g2876, partial [Tremellales sp. Uapishka_1]